MKKTDISIVQLYPAKCWPSFEILSIVHSVINNTCSRQDMTSCHQKLWRYLASLLTARWASKHMSTMLSGHVISTYALLATSVFSRSGPFYGAIAVPTVTRCRCCWRCRCGHRFYIAYLVTLPKQSHVALLVQNLTIATHFYSTSQPQHCESYNECKIILLVLSAASASYNGHPKTYCRLWVTLATSQTANSL